MSVFVEYSPNTGPMMKEVWVFVTRDAEGRENAIAGNIGMLGMTQMMTGNPKTFQLFKRIVEEARPQLEKNGQSVHLLKFTRREEIPDDLWGFEP